jgi:hypothetical protein
MLLLFHEKNSTMELLEKGTRLEDPSGGLQSLPGRIQGASTSIQVWCGV